LGVRRDRLAAEDRFKRSEPLFSVSTDDALKDVLQNAVRSRATTVLWDSDFLLPGGT
jgi:hypothetical protein